VTPTPLLDDLVEAARAGGGWAFGRIWEQLAPVINGYLRARRVPDPDDVTSEVFLAAFQRIGSFDGDGDGFRSWLFTIAHHKGVDAVRASARGPRLEELTGDDGGGTAASAEEAALDRFVSGDVRRMLAALPSDQADVMLLRVLGGLTQAEVAEVTGRSVGAVKQLQRRAVARLLRSGDSPARPIPLDAAPTMAETT
jgi:RNA polymerase sigma-70 factor (ECF subfamily)